MFRKAFSPNLALFVILSTSSWYPLSNELNILSLSSGDAFLKSVTKINHRICLLFTPPHYLHLSEWHIHHQLILGLKKVFSKIKGETKSTPCALCKLSAILLAVFLIFSYSKPLLVKQTFLLLQIKFWNKSLKDLMNHLGKALQNQINSKQATSTTSSRIQTGFRSQIRKSNNEDVASYDLSVLFQKLNRNELITFKAIQVKFLNPITLNYHFILRNTQWQSHQISNSIQPYYFNRTQNKPKPRISPNKLASPQLHRDSKQTNKQSSTHESETNLSKNWWQQEWEKKRKKKEELLYLSPIHLALSPFSS